MATLRRRRWSARPLVLVMSSPSMTIEPSVMSTSLLSERSSVDLPEPDGPMTTTNSPAVMSKLTPSSAWTPFG